MKNFSLKQTLFAGVAAATVMSFGATQTHASTNDILFILDGSGSMWGQIDGVAKIETAKKTMTKLMDEVPGDARVGLMTYGTTDKTSCLDTTVVSALGSNRAQIKEQIAKITPLGKTPIGWSLQSGVTLLSNAEPTDTKKSIVLVSDGIETCDVDPCAIATASQFAGVDMQVHVVGFNVDNEARAQLECIAEKGKGQYFDASDTQGFKDAMQAVVQVAQAEPAPAPEPVAEEPKGPTITEFFRDDFDGDDLAEHWAIENPNPDNFIVEGGVLTMLSTSVGGFEAEAPENLITYTGPLPKGDFDMEITFTGEFTASKNRLTFGLRRDNQNFLTSSFTRGEYANFSKFAAVNEVKASGGASESVSAVYRCTCNTPIGSEEIAAIINDLTSTPTTMILSKRGRSYTSKLKMDGLTLESGEPYIQETTQFTSLRLPGDLSFTVDRAGGFGDGRGEVLVNIDSVVINKVEE